MTEAMSQGVLQADGSTRPEPLMDVKNVANAVLYMASLPLDANVQVMTVMATNMPYTARGCFPDPAAGRLIKQASDPGVHFLLLFAQPFDTQPHVITRLQLERRVLSPTH